VERFNLQEQRDCK